MMKNLLVFLALALTSLAGVTGEWTGNHRIYEILRQSGISCDSNSKILFIRSELPAYTRMTSFVQRYHYLVLGSGRVIHVSNVAALVRSRKRYQIGHIILIGGEILSAYSIRAIVLR